jgi:selenide,water dikinase
VLVSEETGDDAAVYRLPDGTGLVATVDFFTPIVDDPTDWGRIAAANALSDVYAMGGTPKFALAIAGWPVDEVPVALLADVLRGGREVVEAAGAAILGGHTITTEHEPLYGLIALGFVDPDGIVTNASATPGMTLFLTKPIGTGLITTAIKRGVATEEQARVAVETMIALNAAPAAAMRAAGAAAATDVTGFGLLGHLRRMLEASGCGARVDAARAPLLPGVLDLARGDVVAGGTKRNHAWLNETTDWGELTPPERLVLADAQTSGGLLIATAGPGRLRAELARHEVSFAEIGSVFEGRPGTITVVGRLTE